ncbi:uncharacterized protein FOMMEDRAFT_139876 [Fomitiporia mediterranea MF3/22]|uniref:uncharacterized protein n=1 Tax=Fomitiporia mediterranea (strain MF3/22) TaxID=694068 RepID=UPI0004407311|nr:uncharacterized protein FOMMEDRAFT_139876 [Fomitiporia mediterranea MF3/22]EJD03711.1 hypothetical protein FOMMEDRAFT_139876 [Fomitiporia mediterranea MF3/22]
MRSSNRTLLFTFVFALTLLIAFAPQADASANAAASPAHRRQAGRMIRKRQLPPIIQVGSDPTQSSSTADGASTTPASSATSSGTTARPATPTTASSDPLISIGVPSVSSSTSTTSSVSTSTSATSLNATTSSTTSSSSTSSTTSETLSVTSAPDLSISSNQPTQTFTSTLSNAESSATESATTTGATSKSISKTTITIIAVVAASIGGAAIIWTIIRKWKFRPSAEFEDRMQPIDWSPESTHAQTGGPGLNRSASQASHGSFISGSEHGSLTGPRPYAPGTGNLVADIPPHDFTAGPAHLGGGYADLTRGPSPGPQMSQAVARGPSFNRGYGY